MIKIKKENALRRIFLACCGFAIIGFSVAALRVLALGVDPLGAMTLGFSMLTGVSFGIVLLLIHLPVFLVMLWRARELIGIGTVVGMIGIGFATDFFYWVFSFLPIAEWDVVVRVVLLVVTIVIFAFGVALYTVAEIGMVPFDAIGLMVEKFSGGKVKFRWGRLAMDGVCALTAFLLSAPLGVATILTVAGLGPLIGFFMGQLKKRLLLTA